MFSTILCAVEQMIMSTASPDYFRIYAWWIRIQSLATLRFDDHRGINPRDIARSARHCSRPCSQEAKRWEKRRRLHSRPLIIDSECYLHSKEWISVGWRLLTDAAVYEREYLLPSLSTNDHGVVRSEMRYAIADAMQNRVLSSLCQSQWCSLVSVPSDAVLDPTFKQSLIAIFCSRSGISERLREIFWVGGMHRPQTGTRALRAGRLSIIQRVQLRVPFTLEKLIPSAEQDLAEHFEDFLATQHVPPVSNGPVYIST